MKDIRVGNRVIGDGHPAFVVAEMAWAHDGSVENARRIIQGAAEAGADAVGLHITSMRDYMVEDYGRPAGKALSAAKGKERVYDFLDRLNLKEGDWEWLFSYAKSLNLAICAMPNDTSSLALCERLNADMYVVAAACFVEEDLLSRIGGQGKPVILRIGGASVGEIEGAIDLIKKCGTEDIILLHGIQLYPTRPEDTNLRLLPSLKDVFGLTVGLADHVDAESELAFMVPLMGLSLGAAVIEKHITHNRSLRGVDFEAAFNPDEFKRFVQYMRGAEKALGAAHFTDSAKASLEYRLVSRKRVVANSRIGKGDTITRDKIAFKRANEGLYPDEARFVIGRVARRDIKANEPITCDILV